jgi:hypothetical protein
MVRRGTDPLKDSTEGRTMTEQNDPNVIRFRVRYVEPEELPSRQHWARVIQDEDAGQYRLQQAKRLLEVAGLARPFEAGGWVLQFARVPPREEDRDRGNDERCRAHSAVGDLGVLRSLGWTCSVSGRFVCLHPAGVAYTWWWYGHPARVEAPRARVEAKKAERAGKE